jgi:D-glycero-alpha-D-manno-heptose-7-phosphate kinase
MIITRTPYRLSFFGGGTDYRPWFEKNEGIVISSAMARYCYLNVRHLPPFFEHKTRVVYGKTELVSSNQKITHSSVRECLRYMKVQDGLEIHHVGDLPARSGIGSSSSFTVGFLHALHALRYEMVTKRELADEAIKVEQEKIKEDVGIQDQIMAAHGGFQVIKMGPGNRYTVTPLILPPEYLTALEEHVMLAFTGVERNSNQFAKAQIHNIKQGTSLIHLSEIQAIARSGLDLFAKKTNLEEIGSLLDQSWRVKRQIAKGITNDSIDELYATAKKNGVFGGKLMGAGGGGFIMFLAPPHKHETIKKALSHIKVWVPFQIDTLGSQVLFQNDGV